MTGPIRRFGSALLLTAGVCGAALAPGVARADHDSYEYSGPRYGFHGEGYLINALGQMDQAYFADDPSHFLVRQAKQSIRQARFEICDPRARYYLQGALDHLEHYIRWHRFTELDDAARLVTKALAIEREAHMPPPRPIVRRHRPHHGGHHDGGVTITDHGVGVSWGGGGLFVRF